MMPVITEQSDGVVMCLVKPSAMGLTVTSETVNMLHYNVYRDHPALGHYVVLRSTALYTVRYYPKCEEIHISGKAYKKLDGFYQWSRLVARSASARQAEAERLSLDILTWHNHVDRTGVCSCGKPARLTADPWYADVCGRIVYDYICKDCYREAIACI